jgi:hypothetical protein
LGNILLKGRRGPLQDDKHTVLKGRRGTDPKNEAAATAAGRNGKTMGGRRLDLQISSLVLGILGNAIQILVFASALYVLFTRVRVRV